MRVLLWLAWWRAVFTAIVAVEEREERPPSTQELSLAATSMRVLRAPVLSSVCGSLTDVADLSHVDRLIAASWREIK